MPLVLVADLQGNRWALEAVLGRARKLGPDVEVVVLGNAVGAGPDPQGTVELLRKRGAVLVKGERDDAALGLVKTGPLRDEGDANARLLKPADLSYLRHASSSRRLRAHGHFLLLTGDPKLAPTGPETLVAPGPVTELTERAWRLASAATSDGEAPFLVVDDGGARLEHAAWDVDAWQRAAAPSR